MGTTMTASMTMTSGMLFGGIKTTMVGTPLFMAPEQFHQEYSYQIDVWAFGVTLCRLFSLKWPYPSDIGLNDLIFAVGTGALRPNFLEEDDVPDPDVLNVVNQCLLF